MPWLTDGDISIFESGAILLHLAERSNALMSADPHCRSEVREWLSATLNSVEAASLPWSILIFTGEARDTSAWKVFDGFLKTSRLAKGRKRQFINLANCERWASIDLCRIADIGSGESRHATDGYTFATVQ
jgi:glutathione S-transferase